MIPLPELSLVTQFRNRTNDVAEMKIPCSVFPNATQSSIDTLAVITIPQLFEPVLPWDMTRLTSCAALILSAPVVAVLDVLQL
jgi:hypothetical protein